MTATVDWAEYAAREFEREAPKPRHRFYDDPVGFADACIRWPRDSGLTAYQRDVLAALPSKRKVSVRGPHGLGKTTTAAVTVLWFALTRELSGRDWKIPTTAGAWRQLEFYLWPEIKKWARLLNWAALGCEPLSERTELLTLNIKLAHGHAFAAASDNPALIEGAHADSVLYIFDESKAIIPDTFDAAEGAFSGASAGGDLEAFALAMSTPGEPNGRFYEIHSRKPGLEDWWARHVTVHEAIAAGRISREWMEQRRLQWGEDSALFANRVLGEFHSSDEDGVIPLSWVESANERWLAWELDGKPAAPGRRSVGVDVARSGADKTVMALLDGNVVTELRRTSREDTMQTTGRVLGIVNAAPDRRPVVDVIGIGAGVVDRLREQKVVVDAFNASEGTDRTDRSGEMGFTNCLVGSARVRPIGNLLRIYRSRHQGPLYRVETASGDHFTATPHHQILTPGGWVPVQSLSVGDKLCDTAGAESAHSSVGPEKDDVPPSISEVYRAAYRLFGSERMQGGAVDFHGDRPVGEVDVVAINRDLFALGPADGQSCEDLQLLRSLLGASSLLGDRSLGECVRIGDRDLRVRTPLPDDAVLAGPRTPLVKGESVEDEVDRFTEVSRRYLGIAKDSVDNSFTAVETVGEGMRRLACSVQADDLGLVDLDGAGEPGRGSRIANRDARFSQYPPSHIPINSELFAQDMQGSSPLVAGDDCVRIHFDESSKSRGFGAASWLDAVFIKDFVNGGPVGPEELGERLGGLSGYVPLDEVVSVELTAPGHGPSFVYTLETTTGSYRTSSVAHRNCRSAAWWSLRELLDPAYGAELALPPDDLLIGDLTAPHWRVMSGGRIQVESKDDIRKRLGRSTDDGDAVVQAAWDGEGTDAQAWIEWMKRKAEAVGAAPRAAETASGELPEPEAPSEPEPDDPLARLRAARTAAMRAHAR